MKRGNRYPYVKSLIYDEFGQRAQIEYGNGVKTTYTYDTQTRRLTHLKTVENTKKRVIQDMDYQYDLVGNVMYLGTNNTALVPSGGDIGGPTEQNFTYDDLYQLRTANGAHWPAPTKRTSYTNNFTYDIIGNITSKVQTHLIIHGTDSATEPRETNYSLDYKYTGTQPHAVTDAGDRLYTYDLNGNMTGWTSKSSGQRRTIVWNEENRVKSIADQGSTVDFLYDDTGERAVKKGQYGETVYVNRFYSLKNGGLGSKHVFAGETRVVTKLEKDGGSIQSGVPGSIALVRSQGIYDALQQGSGQKKGIKRRLAPADGTTSTSPPVEKFEFFYHGDHLGSSSFITDDAGAVYQHLEYFPYGETWVEDGGSGQMPNYRFTGKELDPETGLYYYGARYYEPVLSRWISADPIIGQYLPNQLDKKQLEKKWKPERDLSGRGGIFRPLNLGLYTYAHHNPVKFIDPLGLEVDLHVDTSTGKAIGIDTKTGKTVINESGYSGKGLYKNDPYFQNVKGAGPLPQGTWKIGPAQDKKELGGLSFHLTPEEEGNSVFTSGRDAGSFWIHADNRSLPGEASEGCFVLSLQARQTIKELGGGKLFAVDMSTSGGAYLMGSSGLGSPDLVGSRYPGSMIGVQSSEIHLMTPSMTQEIFINPYEH